MIIVLSWFYYSKLYILGSFIITLLLNRTTKKLYYPPLIINMVSVILLFISKGTDRTYAMYFNYMPVVTTSIITNFVIFIYKKMNKNL